MTELVLPVTALVAAATMTYFFCLRPMRKGHACHQSTSRAAEAELDRATTTPLVKDPVCGMDVDPATSRHSSERDGQTYYFCSGRCQAKFDASPET